MVVRAAVARALAGAGLLLSVGIHHRNKYNAFCLADDVVEPFRGFVEAKAREIWREGAAEELDQVTKGRMLEVLYGPVTMGGQSGPLMVSLHRTAASVAGCLAGREKELVLPEV